MGVTHERLSDFLEDVFTVDLTGECRRHDVSGASYESAATTVDLTGGCRGSQTSCETAQSSQCSHDTHMSVDVSGIRKMSNTEVVKHSTLAEFITEEPCDRSNVAADVNIEPTVSVQRLS